MGKMERGDRLAFALLGLALFSAYLVMHPYRGIYADALIYVTRAWAPRALVDTDMLFAYEHQTGLTLYGALFRLFNRAMPVAEAAELLALCGVAVWFAGLLMLARGLTGAARLHPTMALAMVALVTLAPLGYSAGSSFMAGEVLSVPRPIAEGFVLMAFAAYFNRRWVAGSFALLVAAAFHPLMGAAGAAVAFVWAAESDRRLWLLALALVASALVAAAFDAPYLANLFATFDADWLALLRVRTSYLFLSEAPVSFWTDMLLRGVIVVVAARLCAGVVRSFLMAALVAGAVAIVMSLLFADLWPSMLVTQLQPWRVLFVLATLAPMTLAIIAANSESASVRVTLAAIACAYMTRDASELSAVFSLFALVIQIENVAARLPLKRVEFALWIVAAAAWIAFDLLNLVAFGQILADAPRDLSLQWSYLWVLRPLSLPLAILLLIAARRERLPHVALASCLLAIAGVIAIMRFDDRAPIDVAMESRRAPELVAALPAGSEPVLWLSLGKEPWYWLNRPNWVAPVQASSIVFSRDLARAWSERVHFLMDHGIYAPEILSNKAAPSPRALSRDSVTAVCGREDAPSAIVAPLRAGESAPEGARRVLAPAPSFQLQPGGVLRFDSIESYAVWTCAREAKR